MEILWDVYEFQTGVFPGKMEKLEMLAENLSKVIPFEGIDANDMTWENLHTASLSTKACRFLSVLVSTSLLERDTLSTATKIMDTVVAALSSCVEILEGRKNLCSVRAKPEPMSRLINAIVDERGYMLPLKAFVCHIGPADFSWQKKCGRTGSRRSYWRLFGRRKMLLKWRWAM
jgi:hypothetical protein